MAKVSMFVKFTAQPGRRQDVVDVLAGVRPLVDEEEGTEVYSFHLDKADENVVWMVDLYRDQEALDAHSSGPAVAQLFGALGDLLATGPELNLTTPLPGKGLDAG